MDKKDNKKTPNFNLVVQMSILIFILAFIEPKNEIVYFILKLTMYTGMLGIFIVYFLIEKRKIFLISISIFTLCWNIFLLTTPMIAVTDLNVSFIKLYNVVLMAIAVVLFYLGQWKEMKSNYWTETKNLSIQKLLIAIVGSSILIQLIMRL